MPVANKRKPAQTFPNASMSVDEKCALWAELERTLPPAFPALVIALEQRSEPRPVAYSSNILDSSFPASFFRGHRTLDADPVVIEVD